ncbi:protein FAM133B-like [Diachasma alloeum]|uniref:protein FAM133B-like n=1 Tax=Diachasma alloeum TaxID=454923 RepID=UPI000738181A|nr:protein FAM133B-like [Diachasma alloeum]
MDNSSTEKSFAIRRKQLMGEPAMVFLTSMRLQAYSLDSKTQAKEDHGDVSFSQKKREESRISGRDHKEDVSPPKDLKGTMRNEPRGHSTRCQEDAVEVEVVSSEEANSRTSDRGELEERTPPERTEDPSSGISDRKSSEKRKMERKFRGREHSVRGGRRHREISKKTKRRKIHQIVSTSSSSGESDSESSEKKTPKRKEVSFPQKPKNEQNKPKISSTRCDEEDDEAEIVSPVESEDSTSSSEEEQLTSKKRTDRREKSAGSNSRRKEKPKSRGKRKLGRKYPQARAPRNRNATSPV